MNLRLLCLELIFAGVIALTGTDPAPSPSVPKPDIQFPTFPAVNPDPPPPVDPTLTPTIGAGQFYVIPATKPFVIIASGEGEVEISKRPPPVQLPVEMAPGWKAPENDPDFITFNEPYIYLVKAKKKNGKDGIVKLEIIPAVNALDKDGKQIPLKRADIIHKTILVKTGVGPQPPPGPGPTPTPTPTPTVSPFGNAAGLHVLFTFQDTDQRNYPLTQLDVLYGQTVRAYLQDKCVKVGNEPERRIWDIDVDTTRVSKLWQDAMTHAKGKECPWYVVGNGDKWEEGKLPKTVTEMMDILKKYGG